jgi:hypothetical protein
MSHSVVGLPRGDARRLAVAIAAIAAITAGCGMGALPASGQATSSREPASPSPTAVETSTSTPQSAVTPAASDPVPSLAALAEPPPATLSGIVSGADDGALGSYTWDGSGSDAPWIVPRAVTTARPGAVLGVGFTGAGAPVEWTARWAPVTGSGAGDVAAGTDGAGAVSVEAPHEDGTWSLQVEASFGEGRAGTWYWRVEVAR